MNNKEVLQVTSILKGVLQPILRNISTHYEPEDGDKCSYCEDFEDFDAWYECFNRKTKYCTLCKPSRSTCPSCHKRICLFGTGIGWEVDMCPKCHTSLNIFNPIKLSPERMEEIEKEAAELAKFFREKISQGEKDDTE